ncbi:MAG: glycosyltransferase [bacterium]
MKKIALVHDWLTTFGGAERVLLALTELYPEAEIFTLVYDEDRLPEFSRWKVHTSFIQKLPWGKKKYRAYLPLMPTAIEQFDFQDFDLVISSSHAVAKGIITRPDTIHISYCHTPMRYAWDLYHFYLQKPQIGGKLTKWIMPWMMHHLRLWDRESADRVDHFIANSHNVAARIKKYYQRDSEVIYPPIAVATTKPQGLPKEDYFVILSRLIPQKNVDLAVMACTRLGKKLKVIGEGGMRKALEEMAGSTVEFVGFQPEHEVTKLLEQAQALIFPCEDDFGMTPVEAMALGTPVIALNRGGARESVIEGKTGTFFDQPMVESLCDALEQFDPAVYQSDVLREHAMQFDSAVFKEKMKKFIKKVTA